MTHLDTNRRAWDARVRARAAHTRLARPAELRDPVPVLDPEGWLGPLHGARVLCLAAGGGLQSALLAAAGAEVTVVDLSAEMLAHDRRAAAEMGRTIRCVETTMEDLSPLADASFDLVLQPVSTCYVPDVRPVFRETARVLAPGGLYISQHKQPVNLQAAPQWAGGGYLITEPYDRTGPLHPLRGDWAHRETDCVEHLHRWEDLLGGLCRAGFSIEDVSEPRHPDIAATPGTFAHRSAYVPPYVKLKARRHTIPTPRPHLIIT
jgi:SAM-dependent methyltransferase